MLQPLYARESALVPIEQEDGLATGKVWTVSERRKFFIHAGILTPGHPAGNYMLYGLCYLYVYIHTYRYIHTFITYIYTHTHTYMCVCVCV